MRPERKYTIDIAKLLDRACINVERLRNNLHWIIEISHGFEEEHKYAVLPVVMEDRIRNQADALFAISNELHHMQEVMKEALK